MIAPAPSQKAAGSTPEPGSASSSTNRCRLRGDARVRRSALAAPCRSLPRSCRRWCWMLADRFHIVETMPSSSWNHGLNRRGVHRRPGRYDRHAHPRTSPCPVPTRTCAARPGGVQSVHRALDLLEVVVARGGTRASARSPRQPTCHCPRPTACCARWSTAATCGRRPTAATRSASGLLPLGASAGAMVGAGAERMLGRTRRRARRDRQPGDPRRRPGGLRRPGARAALDADVHRGRAAGSCHTARLSARRCSPAAATTRSGRCSGRTGLPRHTAHTVTDVEDLLARLARRPRASATPSTRASRRSGCAASPSPSPPAADRPGWRSPSPGPRRG